MRRLASDTAIKEDLCRHAHDERTRVSPDEIAIVLSFDEEDGEFCEICGRERLRVTLVTKTPLAELIPDEATRAALLRNLLR
jgi:hypothetical protein